MYNVSLKISIFFRNIAVFSILNHVPHTSQAALKLKKTSDRKWKPWPKYSEGERKSKLMTIRQSFQNHKKYLTCSMHGAHGATQYSKLESHPKYLLLKLVMYILEHGLAGYCRDIWQLGRGRVTRRQNFICRSLPFKLARSLILSLHHRVPCHGVPCQLNPLARPISVYQGYLIIEFYFLPCSVFTAFHKSKWPYTSCTTPKWPQTKWYTRKDTIFWHSFSCPFTWWDPFCSECWLWKPTQ